MKHVSLGSLLGRWSRVGIAAAAITVGASSASAQFGGGFGGASFRTSIDDREVDEMIEALRLDENQATLVDSLYDGFHDTYESASDEARQKMRDAFQDMRDSGNWDSAMSVGVEFARDWRKRSESLEKTFLGDVQGVLTKEQAELWPRYERDWRRRNSFRSGGQPGALAGENVDLYQVVDEFDLTPEEKQHLDPVLEAYAMELDPALINRDRAMTDLTDLTSKMLDGKSTTEELESKFKSLQRSRVQVRDLNDKYIQMLVAQLDPELGAEVQHEYLQRSFRGIYSPTRADSYIDSVRDKADLNEAQLTALQTIERDFDNQTSALNRQLADLQKKRELEDQEQMFQRLTSMMQGGGFGQRGGRGFGGPGGPGGNNGAEDPRRALMDQKNQLVETTLNSVVAMLTPEQLAAAPKPERDQRGGRRMGGENMSPEQRRQMEERIQRWREEGGGERQRDGGN